MTKLPTDGIWRPNICIWRPAPDGPSETFLDAHAQMLPGRVSVVYGGPDPVLAASGRPLLPIWLRTLLRAKHALPVAAVESCRALYVKHLAKYFRASRFDTILAEYGPSGTDIHTAARRAGVPFVVHFHGFDAYRDDVVTANTQYSDVFAAASSVVAVSRHMLRHLEELGCPPDKLHCIPCGSNPHVLTQTYPATSPPRFIAVGRMVEKKAPHLTVLSFARAKAACPQATLDFIGGGPLLEAARLLARALKIDDSINFLGPLPHDRVLPLMSGARAFLQHSIRAASGDSEGTPVAVVEASMSGLPVVATQHGGIPDAVIHGKTGILVPECDTDSMGEAIHRLAVDPMLAQEMGAHGRVHALANYSLAALAGRLSAVLKASTRSGR